MDRTVYLSCKIENFYKCRPFTNSPHNPYRNLCCGYNGSNFIHDNFMYTGLKNNCPFTEEILKELEYKYRDDLSKLYNDIFFKKFLYNPERKIKEVYTNDEQTLVRSIYDLGIVGWYDVLASLTTSKYSKYLPLIEFLSPEQIQKIYESLDITPTNVQTIIDNSLYIDNILMDDETFTLEDGIKLFVNDIQVIATGYYAPKAISNMPPFIEEYDMLFKDGLFNDSEEMTIYNNRVYRKGLLTDETVPPIQTIVEGKLYFDDLLMDEQTFILDTIDTVQQLFVNDIPVTAIGLYSPIRVTMYNGTPTDPMLPDNYYLVKDGKMEDVLGEIIYNDKIYENGTLTDRLPPPVQKIEEGKLYFDDVSMDNNDFIFILEDTKQQLYVNNIAVTAEGYYSPLKVTEFDGVPTDPTIVIDNYYLVKDGVLDTELDIEYNKHIYDNGILTDRIVQTIDNGRLYFGNLLMDSIAIFTVLTEDTKDYLYADGIKITAIGLYSPLRVAMYNNVPTDPELLEYNYLFLDGSLDTNINVVYNKKIYDSGILTDRIPDALQAIIDNKLYFDGILMDDALFTMEKNEETEKFELYVDGIKLTAIGLYSPSYVTLISGNPPEPTMMYNQYLFRDGVLDTHLDVVHGDLVYDNGILTDKVPEYPPEPPEVQEIIDGKLYFDSVLMDDQDFTMDELLYLYVNKIQVTALGYYTPKQITNYWSEDYSFIFKDGMWDRSPYIEYMGKIYENGRLTDKLPDYIPEINKVEYISDKLSESFKIVCDNIIKYESELKKNISEPVSRYYMYDSHLTICDENYKLMMTEINTFFKLLAYTISMYSIVKDFENYDIIKSIFKSLNKTLLSTETLGDTYLLKYFSENVLFNYLENFLSYGNSINYRLYSLEEYQKYLEQTEVSEAIIMQNHNNTITDTYLKTVDITEYVIDEEVTSLNDKLVKVLMIIVNIYSDREVIRRCDIKGSLELYPTKIDDIIYSEEYIDIIQ